MDFKLIVITVLIPVLAWVSFYCFRLQLQLGECASGSAKKSNSHHQVDRLAASIRAKESIVAHGSSVFCQGESNEDRRCIFHNLCYHPSYKDFVFLHSPQSIYEGVPDDRRQPALADLSSVPNHNTQYFDYVDVSSSFASSVTNLTYLEGRYLLFNRFKYDNLMHVIHDDLLAVFYTMLQLGLIQADSYDSQATLLMSDGQERGEYFSFYEYLSQETPILVKHLPADASTLVCFQEIHVGLSKFTTWYQYGFEIPQGPLDDITVTASEINLFSSFIKSKLNVPKCELSKQAESKYTFILLSRRTNRLILNELDLSLAIARHFDAYVNVASLETHTLLELIALISCSDGLIAVHGSLLSLSIFLPPNSILVEIFPYAINPSNYTPYRTLADLKGMDITYMSWKNDDPQSTVAYPDAEPELGGISHLDPAYQERILASLEVPPHLCCSDPEWLFRIYQDTSVDINSFIEVIEDALKSNEIKETKSSVRKVEFYPGGIRNVTCFSVSLSSGDEVDDDDDDEIGLELSWQPPWNLPYMQDESSGGSSSDINVQYEVVIQEQGGELYSGAFILSATQHTFREGFLRGRVYFAWVRCKAGMKSGPYVAVTSCPNKT